MWSCGVDVHIDPISALVAHSLLWVLRTLEGGTDSIMPHPPVADPFQWSGH